MPRFHVDIALLPDGWARGVTVEVSDGVITAVHRGDEASSDRPNGESVRIGGAVVPGMPNLHSHGFQRAMAGRTERASPGTDDFWSWREVMYDFVDRLDPEDIEAVTALAQVEMLEAGFTSVGEFHYLHHDRAGRPYHDPAETSARVCAAAAHTGIGLTLLPVAYRHGGFASSPASPGQRRFVSDPDLYARLLESARGHAARVPGARVGIAPHSLRAMTSAEILELLPLAGDGPIHLHVAEQVAEVEACLEATGARPVAHLLDTLPVDPRWCLIHATHLDPSEIDRLSRTGATVGLCPVTEANLGDGLFAAEQWLRLGGGFGIGTDSNVRIDLADELRTLEYGRRLADRRRNVLGEPGVSTGRRLFDAALAGGNQAMGGGPAGIAPGAPADFVALNVDDTRLAGLEADGLLDGWIFGADGRVVRDVWVRGRRVVSKGRAHARDEVEAEWRRSLARMGASSRA